ncbi:hypothetical protein HKI87_04g27920 [Chloropicon roscoffensis]|uniref:Clathrin light chain n=1 Tax=Chloropicon roscoffensis TaxID=1461544 RepID=A0AAX4P4K7_9CHLO
MTTEELTVPETTELAAEDPEPSPVLEEPEQEPEQEQEPVFHTPEPVVPQPTMPAAESRAAEAKRLAIEAGQAELEKMRKEIEERAARKREAARLADQELMEEIAASRLAPSGARTAEETWSIVCDLIDFKRETKTDMTRYKALLIQLKHSS